MTTFRRFRFESVTLDRPTREIRLDYALDDVRFREIFCLPAELTLPADDSATLASLLRLLHLAAGISYYKAGCPKEIEIAAGPLNPAEAAFWTAVYEQGLGQFFFENQLDFRDLIHFPVSGESPPPAHEQTHEIRRALVPVGGGKDSAVTIELLREAEIPVTLLRVGSHPLIDAFVEATGLPCLTVERTLAPELLRLNAAGALNGHVPVTAILSLLALIVAELHSDDAVVMSNESSASDGNTVYLGREINHQWSKSLAFEKSLTEELARSAPDAPLYVSLLRPLNELQITRLFADHGEYLSLCTSCNRNWTLTKERPAEKWCGACPKCAFVFVLLAAFVDRPPLLDAFGQKNPLADQSLGPLDRELLGLQGFKPFECVGTPTETIAAFLLARERGQWADDTIMRMFERDVLPTIKDPHAAIDAALSAASEHRIPAALLSRLHAPR